MLYFSNKTPYEEFFLGFSFANDVGYETVSSATIEVTIDGEDVTDDLTVVADQSISSPIVYVKITGGVSGSTYIISCKAEGSGGSKWELEGSLRVYEEG